MSDMDSSIKPALRHPSSSKSGSRSAPKLPPARAAVLVERDRATTCRLDVAGIDVKIVPCQPTISSATLAGTASMFS